jgi:hypothetical protein
MAGSGLIAKARGIWLTGALRFCDANTKTAVSSSVAAAIINTRVDK